MTIEELKAGRAADARRIEALLRANSAEVERRRLAERRLELLRARVLDDVPELYGVDFKPPSRRPLWRSALARFVDAVAIFAGFVAGAAFSRYFL